MNLFINERRMLCVAFGGGLYWASSLLVFLPWASSGSPIESTSLFGAVIMPLVATVTGVFFLLRGRFSAKRNQTLFAASMVVAMAVHLCVRALGLEVHPAGLLTSLVLPGYCQACFVVFWGLNFAVLSKDESVKVVFVTLIFTFAVYAAGSAWNVGENRYLMSQLMKLAGLVPFLLGAYDLPIAQREAIPGSQGLLAPFVLSRCFFGLGIGIAGMVPRPLELSASPVIGFAVCVMLCVAAAYFFRRESRFNALLRVMPLAAVALLILPFFGTDGIMGPLYRASGAIIWLSWIILSSVQLSDMKEKIGWDEARLVLFEKFIVVLSWFIGQSLMRVVLVTGVETSGSFVLEYLPGCIAFCAVLVACYLLSNLIDNKERQQIIERALTLPKKQLASIYRDIARENRLTEREQEILILLASGHNRPAICGKLFISEGTARSHINHIYKKLDIHSREELYEMIRARSTPSRANDILLSIIPRDEKP